MKLTLQIKLLPNKIQAHALLATVKQANAVCDEISAIAWNNKVFNQFKIHNLVYHPIKEKSNLSAQIVVRCISKVADAYKLDKKTQRHFKPFGAITYDARILSYNLKARTISLSTVGGRIKGLPFICHNKKLLPYIKGEADLVTKKGNWYLFQTVEVPEEKIRDVEDFIGVDFGLVNIATLSTGEKMSGKVIENYRIKRQKVRSSLQSKGTKGCKKTLKRLSGKERRTASIVNHTIAKRIVELAKQENKGIALEDLKNIRKSSKNKGRKFRTRIGRWAFYQLRSFIEYKAKLAGVPVVLVNPAYSSQTCSQCLHIGSRNGESFKCKNCGYVADADFNASRNISTFGHVVNHAENSTLLSCAVCFS